MNPQSIRYLSRQDVELIDLPMLDIINALEEMFQEKGAGRTEMPPKPGIHPKPDAFLHAMPAFIPKSKAAGIKWVSAFPDNPNKNLPYISGLSILEELQESGSPLPVIVHTFHVEWIKHPAVQRAAGFWEKRGNNIQGFKETVAQVLGKWYPRRVPPGLEASQQEAEQSIDSG